MKLTENAKILLEGARSDLGLFTLATTPPSYKFGWFHKKLCRVLNQFVRDVEAMKSPRLLVFAPPRHGKSTIVSERLPVFFMGRNPDKTYIGASHTQTLANKFSRSARSIAMSPESQFIFPQLQLSKDRTAVEEWTTTRGGEYKAVGVGTGVSGSGSHIFSVDDPVKGAKEASSQLTRDRIWDWYRSEAYPRLAPGGGVIITMTRWNEDDLCGRIILMQKEDFEDEFKEKYVVFSFPAIAEHDEEFRKEGEALHPERYPIERLNRIRRLVGSYYWGALFQQRPSPAQGGFFQRKNFRYFERSGDDFVLHESGAVKRKIRASDIIAIYQVVDPAGTEKKESDFFALLTFAMTKDYDLILLDLFHEKAETTRHQTIIEQQYIRSRPFRIVVEHTTFGINIFQYFKRTGLPIYAIKADRSKPLRAGAAQLDYENGKIYHPTGAPWLVEAEGELLAFPNGKHDDIVDVIAYASIMKQEVYLERTGQKRDELIPI